MPELTAAQIDLVKKAENILVNHSLGGGFSGSTEFSDFEVLADFVGEAMAQNLLDENLDIAGEALENVATNLAAAHEAAAAVQVGAPSSVDDFVAKLRAVHWRIQANQRFKVASQIAKSLADTIESQTG